MSGEFTDSQKAMIRQIVSDSISDYEREQIEAISRAVILAEENEREWLRSSQFDGEVKLDDPRPLPSKKKVGEIADEAVKRWKESQPKWYDVRRRLDSAGALVLVLSLTVATVYDLFTPETKDLRNAVHYLADTDTRITNGVEVSRRDWIKKPEFTLATGDALKTIAEGNSDVRNPLSTLVKDTLKTSPTMVFHGQQVFRGASAFRVENQICENFMQHLVLHLSETNPSVIPAKFQREPGRAQGICRSQGHLFEIGALDIPFVARFHHTGKDVEPDRVKLALHLAGEAKSEDGTAIDLTDKSPLVGGPKGVCVTYQTTDKNLTEGVEAIPPSGLFVGDQLETIGNGFWVGDITDSVTKVLGVGQVDKVDPRHLLHSINLRIIGSDVEDVDSCSGVESINGANLIVRAFVLVNKPLE